jgi:hypothetical protein
VIQLLGSAAAVRKLVGSVLWLALAAGWAAGPLAAAERQGDNPAVSVGSAARQPAIPRRLAPGVLITIPPDVQPTESHSRHDVVELLKVDPAYDWAKDIRFQHQIWGLEFSFKPIRFLQLDVPDKAGRVLPKRVWYMVYRVRNLGDEPVRFLPRFWLESRDLNKSYPDTILPIASGRIRQREDRSRVFLNTAEIAGEIPAGQIDDQDGVWGYVTWADVDPRTDHFSVFVQGLTNAYRWEDTPEGRKLRLKTLELNFWRPGDSLHEHESEIRYGSAEGVDYRWVYR